MRSAYSLRLALPPPELKPIEVEIFKRASKADVRERLEYLMGEGRILASQAEAFYKAYSVYYDSQLPEVVS